MGIYDNWNTMMLEEARAERDAAKLRAAVVGVELAAANARLETAKQERDALWERCTQTERERDDAVAERDVALAALARAEFDRDLARMGEKALRKYRAAWDATIRADRAYCAAKTRAERKVAAKNEQDAILAERHALMVMRGTVPG